MSSHADTDHARASELLPWLLNGRLEGPDVGWVQAHLEHCAPCRAEYAAQQRIRDALAAQPVVEFAPQASFNRLWQRIESAAQSRGDRHMSAASLAPRADSDGAMDAPVQSRRPWLQALVGLQAAAIVLLGAALWAQRAQDARLRAPPDYRTVTELLAPDAAGSARSAPAIRVIFDDRVRLGDVREILAGTNLSIGAGPEPTGVYTLISAQAATATAALDAALARLRADPRVRFAEIVTSTVAPATRP